MTVLSAMDYVTERLSQAGIDNARGEARVLVGHALALPPPSVPLHRSRRLAADEWQRLETALGERCRRRPMAQVVGRREFWSLEFVVTKDTLDPRPDSETLIEAALDAVPPGVGPCRVLDLGTGTGCLLLAFLSERPDAHGLGVDIHPPTARVARQNADRLGLGARASFVVGDWAASVGAAFDLVLANPPYVASADITDLEPEVAMHEPRRALDGGRDGLECYRAIGAEMAGLLRPSGVAVVEIGFGQAESATAILGKEGLEIEAIRRDLAGVERCLTLRKS